MTTEDVIRRAAEAYEQGATDTLNTLLHEDLHYTINATPEFGPHCVDCRSVPAFYEAVGRILADWTIESYKITDVVTDGDRGAARVRIRATSKHTGRSYDAGLALFFAVKDGKLTEVHEYHDTALVGAARAA